MSQSVKGFNQKTFTYFKSARRNRKKKPWFESHRAEYDKSVREPFEELTRRLGGEFGDQLPRIDFLPRKVSRPLLRNPAEDGSFVRANAMAFFSEKATSQFEWNPGIYISIGANSDDNVMGLGLYMVSSRQMSLLRNGLVEDFAEIDAILSAKKLVSRWGSLRGETYKRFPRGFDETSEPAKYLRHKQFFLGQDLSERKVCERKFFDHVVQNIEVALPFLCWVRETVGVYRRK